MICVYLYSHYLRLIRIIRDPSMKFTHLHTHSHYSLLDGLAKIDDLVARAKELGMESLALTDHGNLYGAVEFYSKAKKSGIKPLLGMEAYVAKGSRLDRKLTPSESEGTGKKTKENYNHLTLLCESEKGWKNLLKLSSSSHLEGFYYKPRVDREILAQWHEGIIALSGCLGGEIAQLCVHGRMEEAEAVAKEYRDLFGKDNFFIEIWHLPNIPDADIAVKGLKTIAKKLGIPVVATKDIHYARPEDAQYQDILLAVQTGNTVNDIGRMSMMDENYAMNSPEEMAEWFADIPEAIENTAKIAERCNVELELDVVRLPKFATPGGMDSMDYLEKIIREGLSSRYKEITQEVSDRMEYEIGVIRNTGYADYFLIVQDFIKWARDHGVVVGPGRGSAAGSLVAYVLNITDVDPIKYDLLFERFLNPDRIQMPDIDIDFADKRRDEVVNYVRQKYGEDRVAQIITFGTMAARAAIRDAGRALGLPYAFCDQVAKLVPAPPTPVKNLGQALDAVEEMRTMYATNPDAKKLIDAAKKLEGVARHASVHACGIIISAEPLTDVVALQRSPQNENSVITQFEQGIVEKLGLLKMDFLGLRNLTIIEEALRLVQESTGELVNISDIPLDDAQTFEVLQNGDTVGVFQFESAGMRRYLKELKPTEFEDVVAMVALYRPGPMELIPDYINRKYGREEVKLLHPMLAPILGKTYGIGIYQEQMMRIARDLAGYTLAEADTLRKAIGKKIKALLDEQEGKLINGMIANGINEKIARKIWELFPPFAKYGFNRSHSVCYGLIGYQTAYLKAHYPIEFMTALFNSESDDVERIAFLIDEAKKHGVLVLPPDINESAVSFAPQGTSIRFGLQAIKNVGAAVVEAIIAERQAGGPYVDLEDFLTRVKHKDINKKSIESLTKAGVFDSFKLERGKVLANMDEILRYSQTMKKNEVSNQNNLFGTVYSKSVLNLRDAEPISKKDKLNWEKELLGLYISDHPLSEHKAQLVQYKVKSIRDLLQLEQKDQQKHRIAGVVTGVKKITTKAGKPMAFARIEDANESIEAIVFTETLARNPNLWVENKLIVAEGKLSAKDTEMKFICEGAVELI